MGKKKKEHMAQNHSYTRTTCYTRPNPSHETCGPGPSRHPFWALISGCIRRRSRLGACGGARHAEREPTQVSSRRHFHTSAADRSAEAPSDREADRSAAWRRGRWAPPLAWRARARRSRRRPGAPRRRRARGASARPRPSTPPPPTPPRSSASASPSCRASFPAKCAGRRRRPLGQSGGRRGGRTSVWGRGDGQILDDRLSAMVVGMPRRWDCWLAKPISRSTPEASADSASGLDREMGLASRQSQQRGLQASGLD